MTDDMAGRAGFELPSLSDLTERLEAVDITEVADSIDEASVSALRALDLGVRLLGETEAAAPPVTRAVLGRAVTTIIATPVTSSERLSRDRSARRAFVLGGPDALAALGPE